MIFNTACKSICKVDSTNANYLINMTRHTTDMKGLSIKIQGAKLWNKIDNNLKKIPKPKEFKAKLKAICLQVYKNQLN